MVKSTKRMIEMRYCKCGSNDPVEHYYYKEDLEKLGEDFVRLRMVPRQDWNTEKCVKVIKCDFCKGVIKVVGK